jgi:hypothetical protein
MANEFIARKGYIALEDSQITGSLSITGNITGSTFSGSFVGDGSQLGGVTTASYIEYNDIANKPALVSGSSQITYSGLTGIPSGIVSGSAQIAALGYATTGSNGFNGNQAITGSLTVTGQVIAQSLNVQQVTSSIVYSSGSNVFGSDLGNTQQLTGSVSITGSLTVNGAAAGTVRSVGLSSSTSGVTIGGSPITTSGSLTLAIATATSTQNGLLSSTDWSTFNGKQNALTNPVTGTGTSGQVAYFTGTSAISSESNLFWDASNDRLGIGTASPNAKLDIGSGDIYVRSGVVASNVLDSYNTTLTVRSNGTTAMFIDSSQRIGIGTTSPSQPLTVQAASNASTIALFGRSTDNASRIDFLTNGGASRLFTIALGSAVELYADANIPMTFATNNTERMRIAAGGSVGIGETSPSNGALSVKADWPSGYSTVKVYPSTALGSGGTAGYGIFDSNGSTRQAIFVANSTQAELNVTANKPLLLATNDAERMRITAGGFVGIRQTSPLAPLHVASEASSDDANVQRWDYAGSSAYQLILKQTVTSGVVRWNFSQINNSTTYNNVLVLDRGNVGIGTTNPAKLLTVGSSTASSGIGNNGIFVNIDGGAALTAKSGTSGVEVQVNAEGSTQGTIGTFSNHPLSIRTNNSNVMWFTTGGNVGIGTTSPGVKLDVNGTIRGTLFTVDGPNDGNFGYVASSWAGSTTYPTLFSDHADRWTMHINPHISYTQNGVNGFAGSMTGATVRMASNPAADSYWDIGVGTNGVGTDKFSIGRATIPFINITSTGNIGINTTSPSSRLSVNSTTANSTVVDVQGTSGQLFSVTDNLVGEIFAVSDISGIPILSVNSNGTVNIDDILTINGQNVFNVDPNAVGSTLLCARYDFQNAYASFGTVSGNALYPASIRSGFLSIDQAVSLSGTWRARGFESTGDGSVTVYQRIY